LEGVTEAVRSHSRGSQRVLELYSLLALNLVREPVSCISRSPRYPPMGATQSRGMFVRSRRRRRGGTLPSHAQPLRGHPQASQQLLLSCSLLPTCPQLLPAHVGEEVGQLLVLREGCHHLIVECLATPRASSPSPAHPVLRSASLDRPSQSSRSLLSSFSLKLIRSPPWRPSG
jgi:hypothetical protein